MEREGDHGQRDRCLAEALARVERVCRRRGVRLTPLRWQVLELIWRDHRAVKAYDLLTLLEPPKKPTTLYRTLDFLVEQGFVHRLATLNAFVGCPRTSPHRALLLICCRCHVVEERPAEELFSHLQQEAERCHFQPLVETVELLGLCQDCRKAGGGVGWCLIRYSKSLRYNVT